MKIFKRVQAMLLAFVVFAGILVIAPPKASAEGEEFSQWYPEVLSGWYPEGNFWYYYIDGIAQTGWLELEKTWYHFDLSGKMTTGWLTSGADKFFFDPAGAMVTGWYLIGNNWYYFNADGVMLTGWVEYNNDWYFLNSNGTMATGWLTSGPNRFYLNPDGTMLTGWALFGNEWYYFNEGGAMVTGWLQYNNYWYHFNSKGEMASAEWREVDRVWYNFAPNGMMYHATGDSRAGLSEAQASFVDRYQGIAAQLSVQYGIPWEAVIAQGILESAAGTSGYARNRNNFFGIGAVDYNPDNARYYDSPEQGWEGYYRFIRDNTRYARFGIFKGTTVVDPYDYVRTVKDAGYATDPNYVAKLVPLVTAILNRAYSNGWATSAELYDWYPQMHDAAARNARGG